MEIKTDKIGRMAEDAVRKAGDFVSEKTVSKESKLWAAFCYIFVLIVPIVALLTERKNDGFVRMHAYHSLTLLGAAFVYYVLLFLIIFIVGLIVPLLAALLSLLNLVPLLVFLYMALTAFKGRRKVLPMIGEYAKKLEEKSPINR